MLGRQLTDFGLPLWSGMTVAGLVLLAVLRRRSGGILLLAVGLPLATMIVLGREVLPRHTVVALPALLMLGGAGIGVAIDRLTKAERQRLVGVAIGAGALGVGFVPFALTAYGTPELNPYPRAVWTQYFSEHSAGYGLREAVEALPQMVPAELPIIASMTADSCRRTNFHAVSGREMNCADAPGLTEMQAALADPGEAYVVVETATGARFPEDAEALGATAEQVAIYPRPGADGQPVRLWRLTRG
jgi:4-amino-4-deoxy-L-arabinose transferase-like glycosyltransferase